MSIGIYWFTNDLRITHNPALDQLASICDQVILVYILENDLNNHWSLGEAQRWWLHHSLTALQKCLENKDQNLVLRTGVCQDELLKLVDDSQASHVFWNTACEPYTKQRNQLIAESLQKIGIITGQSDTYLLTDPENIRNKQGQPFKVYTPFWKHCLTKLAPTMSGECALQPAPELTIVSDEIDAWQLLPKKNWADQFSNFWQPGEQGAHKKLEQFIDESLTHYSPGRDFPAQQHTSKLSPHLHFGEISPHQVWYAVQEAVAHQKLSEKSVNTFLSQLGWREFSYHLLTHNPDLPTKNFRAQFDAFPWVNDATKLSAWQKGETGYPIVDAGMRELWQTGYMHNRVRMIVASFLIKDLMIDWREGERWFWDTLLDADLANNAASWQWVAGSGADAAPYFRIFNPVLQGQKFDPDGQYIQQWVPELHDVPTKLIHKPWEYPGKLDYPKPIVEHSFARKKALAAYDKVKNR